MDEKLKKRLLDGVPGISGHAMRMHIALLERYEQELAELESKWESVEGPEWTAIAKRGAFVRNAVLLHDSFFGALAVSVKTLGMTPAPGFESRVTERFGSWERMFDRLKLVASDGNSWGLLVEPEDGGSIDVCTLGEHHIGSLVDVRILFALDGWEHSYWYDFGPSKETYLSTVLGSVDWSIVASRSRAQ